jgi:hypothetical protein
MPGCLQQERLVLWPTSFFSIRPRGERVGRRHRPNDPETAGCIDPCTSLQSQSCIEGKRVRFEVNQQLLAKDFVVKVSNEKPVSFNSELYQVVHGDTLYSISKKFNICKN